MLAANLHFTSLDGVEVEIKHHRGKNKKNKNKINTKKRYFKDYVKKCELAEEIFFFFSSRRHTATALQHLYATSPHSCTFVRVGKQILRADDMHQPAVPLPRRQPPRQSGAPEPEGCHRPFCCLKDWMEPE